MFHIFVYKKFGLSADVGGWNTSGMASLTDPKICNLLIKTPEQWDY
jgi:hypothetical protein